jgi:arylsulfatase A
MDSPLLLAPGNPTHTLTMKNLVPVCYLFLCCLLSETVAAQDRPNIVVIMADDLGYGDVGCNGATEVATPNIDRLAAQGQRFTSGYSSASTCTPTRFSFLTGTYAFRQKGTGVAPPNSPALIEPGTVTLPNLLQKAGYQTAVIGKWHLGLGTKPGPNWNDDLVPGPLDIGFHHCLLLPTTNDRVPQVFVEDRRVKNLDPNDPLWVSEKPPTGDHPTGITHRETLKMDWSHGHNCTIHNGISRIGYYTGGVNARFRDEDLSDVWVAQAKEWMSRHASLERPFFLFLASHQIHVPRIVHERFQGKSPLGPRGDAIIEFDWSVGQVLSALAELQLTEKTLVILCSDNGPVLDDGYKDEAIEKLGNHRPSGPFRGGKYNVHEAGTRTPFITHWPGRIPVGVSDAVVCTVDLAASLAEMTGVMIPHQACLDSQNVLDALLGVPGAKGRDHLLLQDNGTGGNFGFRVGRWKLLRHDSLVTWNVDLRFDRIKVPQYQLFDLELDPREEQNVLEQNPQVAQALQARLQQAIDSGRTR